VHKYCTPISNTCTFFGIRLLTQGQQAGRRCRAGAQWFCSGPIPVSCAPENDNSWHLYFPCSLCTSYTSCTCDMPSMQYTVTNTDPQQSYSYLRNAIQWKDECRSISDAPLHTFYRSTPQSNNVHTLSSGEPSRLKVEIKNQQHNWDFQTLIRQEWISILTPF